MVDVSDPANPTEVGFYDTPGDARDVALGEGYAYVADGDAGLRVVDISDPMNPIEVGFFDTPGYARGVAVEQGYAYVADHLFGLRVVDVSDPADPTEAGFYDTPGWTYDTAVAGDYTYVADRITGVIILNFLLIPATPPDSIEISGLANGVVNNTYSFTANVDPISTTLPVTYSWQATAQQTVTHTGELATLSPTIGA